MTVIDKQNFNLKKAIEALLKENIEINVGILDDPKGSDVSAKTKKTGSPLKVVDVAAIHEFGAPKKNIPQRSFLLSTFEAKKAVWAKAFKTLLGRVSSAIELDNSLEQFGQLMQRDVRLKFTNNQWKPLKYRKGNPLLDSGQLRRSVSYQIKRGKK